MKKFILASTIALGLAACNPPTPNPDVGAKPGLRLLEVTIDLRNNDASAVVLEPNRQNRTVSLLPQATTSIEVNRIGVGFHDDNDGANQTNPTRYVYAVFRIENNTGTALNNFTTWALNVPALSAGIGPTRVGTMFKSVKDGAGLEVADDNIVRSIEPTHGIRPDLAGIAINPNHADLQIIGSNEKTTVQGQLAAAYGGLVADVLGYGYVARKNNGNARDIGVTNGVAGAANSCSADSCKGFLTLAFKVPVATLTVAPRSSRPTVFSFIFALGDQTETFTTQSIKDQNGPTIAGLPTTTFFGQPRLLAGSTTDFYASDPKNLCQVETARPSGAFPASVMLPATVDTTAGTLDTCFGSGGWLRGNKTSGGIRDARASIVDSQDRIYVAGSSDSSGTQDMAVWRFKSDGSPDNTFGGNGLTLVDFGGDESAAGIALDSTGRVVIAGNILTNTSIGVARLTSSGVLDTAFSGDGLQTIDKVGFSEQAKGVDTVGNDIFVAGTYLTASSDLLVAKILSGGALDATFGTSGITTLTLGAVDAATGIEAVNSSEIYVVGNKNNAGTNDWGIAKLGFNGALAVTFNGTGTLTFDPSSMEGTGANTTDLVKAVKVDSSGRLVMVGTTGDNFALARVSSTGIFDATFAGNGVVTNGLGGPNDVANALTFTSDGSIIAAGYGDEFGSLDYAARKFSVTGTASTVYGETDFDKTNTLSDYATGVVVLSTGKIVLTGNIKQGTFPTEIGLAQYNP